MLLMSATLAPASTCGKIHGTLCPPVRILRSRNAQKPTYSVCINGHISAGQGGAEPPFIRSNCGIKPIPPKVSSFGRGRVLRTVGSRILTSNHSDERVKKAVDRGRRLVYLPSYTKWASLKSKMGRKPRLPPHSRKIELFTGAPRELRKPRLWLALRRPSDPRGSRRIRRCRTCGYPSRSRSEALHP
jgi:hypothetical protein